MKTKSSNHMKKAVAIFTGIMFVMGIWAGCTQEQKESESAEWISLFNGQNLDGWHMKITGYELDENFGNTFQVADGVLKVSYDEYDAFDQRFGHIFYEQPFSHYRLRLEYRFIGEQCPGGPGWAFRNSGIMIHGQSPQRLTKDQKFPVSIEVQLLGGNGQDERTTGNLCTPGTHVVLNGELETQHCISSSSPTFHGDQWVQAEVEVHGNELIKHIINGDTVLVYEQPQLDESDPNAQELLQNQDKMLTGGTISLQAESHPVEFRNIEIMELDKD